MSTLPFEISKKLQFDERRSWMLLILFAVCCVGLTVITDNIEATFAYSHFYLSESLLFSSFWLLFIPLLYAQQRCAKAGKTNVHFTFLLFIPPVVHWFAYPAIVWLISKLCFDHTFAYWQTFRYGFTEYFFTLPLVYLGNFASSWIGLTKEAEHPPTYLEAPAADASTHFAATWLVRVNGTSQYIQTKDIRFFSANSPYVTIHHHSKKYLQFDTLKSVLEKVDNNLFVRVHKSTVVNLTFVVSYTSRQNGDYDLILDYGAIVRLSRNYAADFKKRFEALRSR